LYRRKIRGGHEVINFGVLDALGSDLLGSVNNVIRKEARVWRELQLVELGLESKGVLELSMVLLHHRLKPSR